MAKEKVNNSTKKVEKKSKKVKTEIEQKVYPNCEYKYELEDNYKGALFVYNTKLGKRGKRLQTLWLPLVFLMVVGLLIWDIIDKESIILDCILLGMVLGVEIMTWFAPMFVKKAQKRIFDNLKLAECELLHQDFTEKGIKEYFVKDNEVLSQVVNLYDNISAVGDDQQRIYIMYGSGVNMSIIRKDCLHDIDAEALLSKLQQYAVDYKIKNAKK